jgi:Ca-activated chloride channel family protein
MKREIKLVSALTGAALLASSLTGCGGSKLYPVTSTTESTGYNTSYSDACSEADCTEEGGDYSYNPVPVQPNTESYDKPEENGYNLVQSQPLSTFAADVDTASYANVRRLIENGYGQDDIDPMAVRPEEFINYFSYDLNAPKKGDKFGVTTEISGCPWNDEHQLMFVGVQAEDQLDGEIPDTNLVFLIDVSGSMDATNKLPLLQKSFSELVDNLPCEGTVSIVTYASYEEVVLDGESMENKDAIKKALNSLEAGGSTAGQRGMEMAYEVAKEHFIEGGNNRIIMATDGDLNVGISDPDELEEFIKEKKESGVYLSVLGFGTGNYKDDKLERLADCGNGNYSYIDSTLEAHKVLVDEMTSTLVTVAKDVKFQVEFNPATVNAYRLIGYENRTMDAVDFNDDKKDGGEMGSGHTVVALYEIIPAGSESAIDLKYQGSSDNASDDYATIKIRYKEPDADESKLVTYVAGSDSYAEQPGENLKLASIVSEFALLLSDSEYSGTATFSDILEAYETLENTDEYTDEFYQLVRMVEKRG